MLSAVSGQCGGTGGRGRLTGSGAEMVFESIRIHPNPSIIHPDPSFLLMDAQRCLPVPAAMTAAACGEECFFVEGHRGKHDRPRLKSLVATIPGGYKDCSNCLRVHRLGGGSAALAAGRTTPGGGGVNQWLMNIGRR